MLIFVAMCSLTGLVEADGTSIRKFKEGTCLAYRQLFGMVSRDVVDVPEMNFCLCFSPFPMDKLRMPSNNAIDPSMNHNIVCVDTCFKSHMSPRSWAILLAFRRPAGTKTDVGLGHRSGEGSEGR